MNVQCVLCKEIVPIGDFRSSERGIEITCGACGRSYRVDAPGAEIARPAIAAGEPADGLVCPKCEAAVAREAAACGRCGLATDRFEGFELDGADQVPEALRELWAACLADWQDDAVHDRFVKAAVAAEAYRFAAMCYRAEARRRGGDPVADRYLADIGRRAEVAILQSAAARRYQPPVKEPYRGVAILLAVLVALAAAGAAYALLLHDRQQDEVTRPVPGNNGATPRTRKGAR